MSYIPCLSVLFLSPDRALDWAQTAQVTELYAHLTAYDDDIGRLNSPAPSEREAVGVPA